MALIRQGPLSVLLVLGLAATAVAGTPDYDAFSDLDGNITTEQHGKALIHVLRDSGQLEAIYADAEEGNPRARRVFRELETSYFPDIGRELAERVSRPPCVVPFVRELSGWCVPSWSFIDFLSQDKPGGARLRKALFAGFEERARQRRLENQFILSAMNALLGAGIAAKAIAETGVATAIPRVPKMGAPKPTPKFEVPTNRPQFPPQTIPAGWRVRQMPPTEQYPGGYWKLEKPMSGGSWQPIDPSTMKPGTRAQTHVPLPPRDTK